MAELPFWEEEECLRAPLPAPTNPPPARTLFDSDDLFCCENDLDNLPETLPPLPVSPLLNPSSAAVAPLSPPISPPIPLSLPQTPPSSVSPSEDSPDSPRFFLPHACDAPLPSPSHASALLSATSLGESVLQQIPPCSTSAHHLPPPPPPPPLPSFPSHSDILPPSQPASPPRPWRSFLDDNCPLRKRVKVTIIPTNRKRERPVTTMDPKTHQPTTAAAPLKRRRSCPISGSGAALSTSTITGELPSTTIHNAKYAKNIATSNVFATSTSPFSTTTTPPAPRRVQATLCATRGSRLSLNVPVRRRRSRGPARALRGGRPGLLSDALTARLARVRNSNQLQQQKRLSAMLMSSPCGKGNTGAVRRKTTARASSQMSSTTSTKQPVGLPLVDAAVTAVSRAARAYSETLARVAALPVGKGAEALGLALPGSAGVSTAHSIMSCGVATASTAAQVPSMHAQLAKRTRRVRKKRELLSFDDEEVAPIGEDEGPRPAAEALTRYLNSPSPVKLYANLPNPVSCRW